MSWRSKFVLPAAIAAALTAGGCFPLVDNQTGAQRDLIGSVDVSADVCSAPQLLPYMMGPVSGLPTRASMRRRALSGEARALARGDTTSDFFSCPDAEQLEQWLGGSPETSILLGLPHQLLVAYRVPAGATAPQSFEAAGEVMTSPFWDGALVSRGPATPARRDVDLTFRRAPEMDSQLDVPYEEAWSTLDGRPDLVGEGEKLVGYVSDQLPGPLVGDMTVTAGFGLPAGTATEPYAGPFNALTLLGSRFALTEEQLAGIPRSGGALRSSTSRTARALRAVSADPTPEELVGTDRPVECLTQESVASVESLEELISLSWCPVPAFFWNGDKEAALAKLKTLVDGVDTATRDLRVLGGEGFAEQGATASVPFTLRGAGAASATELGLSATSALAGATATPGQATTPFPGAGDHGRSVSVQVPENATPGTYDVTLTATVGGEQRAGTGRVVVLPKPAAPSFSSSALRGRDNVYMDRDGNIAFGWICPPACGDNQVDVTSPKAGIAPKANTAAVTKPRLLRIARGRFQAANATRARVKVRLFPRARRAVRKGRQVKAIIVVRTGGKGAPSVRRVTIKLRKPKR